MRDQLKAGLAAGLGGTTPTALKLLLAYLSGNNASLPHELFGYLVALILTFVLISGLATFVVKDTDRAKAFYFGMSLVASGQLGYGAITQPRQTPQAPQATLQSGAPAAARVTNFLAAPAFAEEVPVPVKRAPQARTEPAYTLGRKLALEFESLPNDTEVLFVSKRHRLIATAPLTPRMSKKQVVPVPDQAEVFTLRSRDAVTSEYFALDDSKDSTTVYWIEVRQSFWDGFRQAFGALDVPTQSEFHAKRRLAKGTLTKVP